MSDKPERPTGESKPTGAEQKAQPAARPQTTAHQAPAKKAAGIAGSASSGGAAGMAAPRRSSSSQPSTAGGTSNGSKGGTLATIAAVLGLIAVASGFYLWSELAKVQQTLASATGVDQGQLDKLQQNLEKTLSTQTEKATAELKATVAEARGELAQELTASASKSTNVSTSLQGEFRQSIAQVQGTINGLRGNMQQRDAETERLVATTRGELQGEFHQGISQTNDELAKANAAISELKGSFGELRQQVNDQVQATMNKVDERLQTTAEAQAAIQATLTESQAELRNAVGRNRVGWALAEVEYMLNVANEQVLLEGNPAKAITTLRTADQRLKALNDPTLLSIRDTVKRDIAALEKVQVPDIPGIALTLDRLTSEAEQLHSVTPSATNSRTTTAAVEQPPTETIADSSLLAVKGFANAAWEGIRGLAIVKKDGQVIGPLLPPDQAFFLQKNLQLKLQSARLALLRQDDKTFHASLTTALEWTEDYFDSEATTTKKFIEELKQLNALNLAPALPDISNSLQALRAI